MVLPSFIWDYFVKDPSGKFVICTLCPAQTTRFAYSGGTSTMNRHLRKKHQKYAPGKCAADYEYPRGVHRRVHLQAITSPATAHSITATNAGLLMADTAGMLGSLSPGEPLGKQRHQLLELRTARRRAASSKRRKLVVEQPEPSATLTTEFDPAGFVTLPTTTTAASGALQFPAGFELNDAAMEMGGLDQRFFDYSTLTSTTGLRGRRHSSSISGNSGTSASNVNNAANQKILTHRLLKYLIAQYEPLDVSHMGAELSMLLFGGSTEWPTPGLNFGYGGTLGFGTGGTGPKLPSEDTIKLALANLYYSQREILKEVMADVEVLSLSLNNWTSAFGQNVLTVSGHWISRGFRRRDCVLEVYVLPLDERVNTIALLRDVMDKWDIPSSKVAALTMRPHTPTTNIPQEDDSDVPRTVAEAQAEAEAEATAIHTEYPGLAVVRCFVEELEGAVSTGLRECVDLTRRCRNYVSYFIQNPSEYQIFLALQRSMDEEASAASAASAQTASIAATADGVSVSITESGNASIGDELDGGKEDQGSDAITDDGASSTHNATAMPQTSGSSPNSNEALPVICDYDDRWNSTTQMMCRIVELEPMLLRYKTGLDSDTNPARRPMQLRFECCELSPEEWVSLEQLARLLEPIEGLVHVSPLTYPGLSIVYSLLHALKKHLDDAGTWVTDPLVATIRHTIINNLNMDLCSSGQAPSSPYLSCLLDPRFKSLPFLETSEKERLVESLYLLLGVNDKDDSVEESDPATEEDQTDEQKKQNDNAKVSDVVATSASLTNKKAAALLHEFFPLDEPATELEKLKAQVQQYLDSPSLPATADSEHDPLEWWSRYQRLFPSLARLAKKYLCISAVSTPFQEAFTNYGQLMREKKARLDIEVAAQVLFCRSVSRIPEMERIGV
ncbi:Transposase [Phytophthora megakarya]|uniref:Transposase n=1 Tax=Phytophthora megakarya TaxID=4795 RepID=A0A225VI58_9STRA|nr:Transposase [Phytophthora megakarya]